MLSAELKLTLPAPAEVAVQGWVVAAGSSCPTHGMGVLLVVSPTEAAKMQAAALDNDQVRARIACAAQRFARAVAAISNSKVSVVELPDIPPDPRRQ